MTKGPWRVEGMTVVNADYTAAICTCWAKTLARVYAPTETERDANARLIAAAPELLAALEGLLSECSCLQCSAIRALIARVK